MTEALFIGVPAVVLITSVVLIIKSKNDDLKSLEQEVCTLKDDVNLLKDRIRRKEAKRRRKEVYSLLDNMEFSDWKILVADYHKKYKLRGYGNLSYIDSYFPGIITLTPSKDKELVIDIDEVEGKIHD